MVVVEIPTSLIQESNCGSKSLPNANVVGEKSSAVDQLKLFIVLVELHQKELVVSLARASFRSLFQELCKQFEFRVNCINQGSQCLISCGCPEIQLRLRRLADSVDALDGFIFDSRSVVW